jgi:hypothetical protein
MVHTEVTMVDAALIFIGGVGLSVMVMLVIGAAAFNLFKHQNEVNCQIRTYYEWILRSGTEEQKVVAERMKQAGDLEGLKGLVGTGILVDPEIALSKAR